MEGNLGRLFRELALAIAAAVAISAFVALTLSPMMCSKLLVPHDSEGGLSKKVDATFNRIAAWYRRMLERTVEGFRAFAACLTDPHEKGVISAAGVWRTDDVKGRPAMKRAYETGKGI